MDKDEMENNLGTICRSGSLQFKQALDKDKAADTDIIGRSAWASILHSWSRTR